MRRLAALACVATLVFGLHLRRARAGAVRHPGANLDLGPTAAGARQVPAQAHQSEPSGDGRRHLGERWSAAGHLPLRRPCRAPNRGRHCARLVGHPASGERVRVRRRPPRHRPGVLPRVPQRRQHRPARPGVGPGVPTLEPRIAAAVQPLPVHTALGHPAGSADRRDPADADRLPRTARQLGVRRRQLGHARPVHPRPGQPDRYRAGGPAAHEPGAVSRPSVRRHHSDRVPLRR